MAGTGRVDYLDGIRAIAIGAVLSLHWLSWYSPLFHGGSIGVDVFFVLSGFIITTMLWRSRGHRPRWAPPGGVFVKRRVVRLYPALLGLVVVAVVLYAVTPSAPLGPRRGGPPRPVRARARLGRLGGRTRAAASGCPGCTRSGRRGRWPSSGTSTCSGRCSCSRQGARPEPRPLAVGSLVAARPALPRGAAAERLLVLLRPVGALRRAARRRRAGAVVPGRRRARPARAAARPRPPCSRWPRSAAITPARPGRPQPALPLRRGAGRRARDRAC